MGMGGPDNPCKYCNGTGDDGSGFCISCLGTGKLFGFVQEFLKEFSDDVKGSLNDIKEKVDEIKEAVDAL